MAMAHGYAKAAGKPMLVMVHGIVGLLHSSMALFQAWADRVPLFVIAGTSPQSRRHVNRPHSAQDMGSLVRDFVKFDDEATTLERFADSAMRAYRIAMTPPMGPVLLVVDAHAAGIALRRSIAPADPGAVAGSHRRKATRTRCAKRRVCSCTPRAPLIQPEGRTHAAGWDLMVELAELLQAPVDVGGLCVRGRIFPSWHPLYGTGGPGLHAGRDARPRSERHVRRRAQRASERTQDDQHLVRAAVPAQQHSRLRPLRGRRSGDRRRCGGDAAARSSRRSAGR